MSSTTIEEAALAIHAQRRRSFTVGPAPHNTHVEISHRSGATWEIRFSDHMPEDAILKTVHSVVGVARKPNASPEVVAFTLAYIQAESDNIELSSGGAS